MTEGKVSITIDAFHMLRSQDAKIILGQCLEKNNEVCMSTFCFPVHMRWGMLDLFTVSF
jgi:hypothetical protein